MWRGWINTILAHLSPGVRDRKCACERHLVKANTTSEIFREGKKYAQDRSGPCHQRVSNTLQAIFSLLDLAMHPHSLAPPCPRSHLHFPSPSGSALSHAAMATSVPPPPARPQRGRGTRSLRGKDSASGAPDRKPISSYRLWSSPPPAEPRCFPPS